MQSYFIEKKERITAFLEKSLREYGKTLAQVHPMGPELAEKLLSFTARGKMVRGGLVGLGYELFSPPNDALVIPLGAVHELLQSALLVHDDIMDRDRIRRGAPSVYDQYITFAENRSLAEPYHIGEALGICAGDIAYFLAFQLLGESPLADWIKTPLVTLCAKELSRVGVAQMVDVVWGSDSEVISVEDILHLYSYKTARYTFSLPLMTGAIAAEQADETIVSLEQIGVLMGTIFQLKDDELGMFAGEAAIGKPIGSDIREGKKTLYYYYLMEDKDIEKREHVRSLFGKRDLNDRDLATIRDRLEVLGVREKINHTLHDLSERAKKAIEQLDCQNAAIKTLLVEFLDYGLQRTR